MRIAMTGASGFLGAHLLPQLAQLGQVHALSRHPIDISGVRWHACDLFDDLQTSDVIQSIAPTHLVHLAWCTEPGVFWNTTDNVRWLQHSLNLVRAFLESGGRHVIVAGSCAEHGACSAGSQKDVSPLEGATLYAATKNALHAVSAALCARVQARLAWGRIFYVYGSDEAPGRFLSSAARSIARAETIALRQAERRLDYVHVSDVAAAFAALTQSEAHGSFDIGSGQARTVRAMIAMLAAAAAREPKVTQEPATIAAPDVVADIEKMRALGWAPRVTFEEGVAGVWRVHART